MKRQLAVQRSAHAIFCEDVRAEMGGKLSLMGIYHGFLFTPASKLILPKLCAMVTVRSPATQPFSELTIRLLKDDDEVASHTIDVKALPKSWQLGDLPDSDDKTALSVSVLQVSPFEITSNCILRARVETESEILKAGALVIRTQKQQAYEP